MSMTIPRTRTGTGSVVEIQRMIGTRDAVPRSQTRHGHWFSPACDVIGHCLGRDVGATLLQMKKSVRHLFRHGRLFLVLMLVFASIVPGAVHAATMAGSGVAGGSGHHVTGHSSGDHSMMDHHQVEDVHSAAGQDSQPASHDKMTDRCCPTTCFVALCSFEVEQAAMFIPDSFEIELKRNFVVTAMALPERPPRV